jgi:hypothetical protein
MSAPLLYAVACAYLWVAGASAWEGRWGYALAFAAYALANVGFAIDLRS